MQQTIDISTPAQNGLCDITRQVEAIVAESGVQTVLANVDVHGATAAVMVQFKFTNPLQNETLFSDNLQVPEITLRVIVDPESYPSFLLRA